MNIFNDRLLWLQLGCLRQPLEINKIMSCFPTKKLLKTILNFQPMVKSFDFLVSHRNFIKVS